MPLFEDLNRPAVIGHRGAMAYAPENTMASFALALEMGADGIECDIHLSKDGEVVVIHDFTLERTTTGRGLVGTMSLAELQSLDAGSWYAPAFAGERIPTLRELMVWFKAHSTSERLVIELKAGSRRYPGIESKVVDLVHEYGLASRCLLISFDHEAVRCLKRLDPNLAAGVLYEAATIDPGAIARPAEADTIGPNVDLISPEEVALARESGFGIFVWTANEESQVRKLRSLGVDAFGTNYPDRAKHWLNS